jgi:Tfp pilus assembly protein PilN
MEINLNLLPQNKKEEIFRLRRFHSAIGWEIIFSLIFAALGAFLVGLYFILNINYELLSETQNIELEREQYKSIDKYEKEFEEINAKMALVTKVKDDQLYWSDFFAKMEKLINAEIKLGAVTTKEYAVFLVGKAANRDSLIAFKERLEKDECLMDINLPLSNLTAKNDIDFQIDLKIKKDCLKRK